MSTLALQRIALSPEAKPERAEDLEKRQSTGARRFNGAVNMKNDAF